MVGRPGGDAGEGYGLTYMRYLNQRSVQKDPPAESGMWWP